MSRGKCIKPRATKTAANTLPGLVLVLALAALLFPVATWADTVLLDNGRVTLRVGPGLGGRAAERFIEASGPGLSVDLQGAGSQGPFCAGNSERLGVCLPGTFFHPEMVCDEACRGTATYRWEDPRSELRSLRQ